MKRLGLVVGGIVLVALLAGAAFVGGRLINRPAPGVAGGKGSAMKMSFSDGSASGTFELSFESAEELPDTPPEAAGIFVRRQDNSFFVGTGGVTMEVLQEEDGTGEIESSYDGPVLEVVVVNETQVYKDVTLTDLEEPPSSGVVKQKLEPGSIEEIGDNSSIQAWGERRGDRVVASVLVYSQPQVMRMR